MERGRKIIAGADNLKGKGFESRSTEEVREIASKGGKNSGAARRRKKTMKSSAQLLMETPVPKNLQQKLRIIGVSEDDANYQMAMVAAIMQKALQGDINAAKFMLEVLEEDSDTKGQKRELAFKREIMKAERQQKELMQDSITEDQLSASLRELAENGLESDE